MPTLSRKIIYWNAALVIGLVLLGTVAVIGLSVLRYDVRVALDEYKDREAVERIKLRLAAARFASRPAMLQAAGNELNSARREVDDFIAAQHVGANGEKAISFDTQEHDEADTIRKQIDAAAAVLRDEARHDPAAIVAAHQSLAAAVSGLDHLGHEMDQTVRVTQEDARLGVLRTMFAVAGVAIVIIAAAVAVSRRQYRSIMGPLQRLRAATGEMARGQLDRRVPVDGDEEYRRLAEDFNHMAAELESFYRELEQKVAEKGTQLARSERLASVGFLAAGVAHEINNPLSIISGYAELSIKRLRRERGNAEVERTLEVIRDEAFRCKEITKKLLELARGGPEGREVLELDRLAADVAELVGGLQKYADRHLLLRFNPGDDFRVRGNPTELKQVLLNLTVNGLEAVPPRTGEVVIEAARDNGAVRVVVRDNGRGMTPDVLDRVFEPFFTAKRGAGEPGTGLGLSITHAIVEGHGGTIRAQSPGPGKGSAFTITLPAASPDPPQP